MTVSGGGFRPGTTVVVRMQEASRQMVVVGSATANAEGRITISVPVPTGTAAGNHRMEAAGRGLHDRTTVLFTSLRVIPKPGSAWWPTLLMVGLSLLVPAGTWLFLVARVRQPERWNWP